MKQRRFSHDSRLRTDFPNLSAIALTATLQPIVSAPADAVNAFIERAKARLANGTESEFPEIQAWRRTFAQMGLKPTQYRCAAESLLRRLRLDGSLPSILPIIDLCNAVSAAYAVPVAVFDATKIIGNLTVRYATGDERYLAFSGEIEKPPVDEVIFADEGNNAHARRWTHRQSRLSAASENTEHILIISEAMHEGADSTIMDLGAELAHLLTPIASSVDGPTPLDSSGIEF